MQDSKAPYQHPVEREAFRAMKELGNEPKNGELATVELCRWCLEKHQDRLPKPHHRNDQLEMIDLMSARPLETQLAMYGLTGEYQSVTELQMKKAKTPLEKARLLIWALHGQMAEQVDNYL